MDFRSFKNAEIDRLNEEQMTTECARCGHRGLTEGEVCIREWEGDSDAPMCAPCWDETEEEECALEEEGEEGLKNLHSIRRGMFGFASTAEERAMSKAELVIPTADNLDEFYNEEEQREIYQALKAKFEDPDMVSAEIVEEGHPMTPLHNYCVECDCCIACGCCECDDEEEGEELLVCLYCGRDERECEAKATDEDNGNPITVWKPFNWGMSCDECYYQHHPDPEERDYDDEDPECCKCGTTTDTKGMGGVEHREDLDGGWWCGRCYEYAMRNPCDWCRVIGEGGEPEERDYDEFISTPQDCPSCEMERQEIIADTEKDELNSAIDASGNALY